MNVTKNEVMKFSASVGRETLRKRLNAPRVNCLSKWSDGSGGKSQVEWTIKGDGRSAMPLENSMPMLE